MRNLLVAAIEGVVTQVADNGYPRFSLALQPESGDPIGLYLNAESGADLGDQAPSSFEGQNVVAYYITVDDPQLVNVATASGAPVFPEDTIPPSAEDVTVTGVLSGADATTSSDLPDIISVTDTSGAAQQFEIFITPELVAVNGQTVSVMYRPGQRYEITLMRVATTE
jgi:hypothetical protein